MDQELLYEKIEKYLNGQLSGDELASFELQLKKDPKLRQEVTLHQEVQESLNEKEVVDFEKKITFLFEEADLELAGTKKTIEKELPVNRFSIKRVLSIAATVLFLIVGGFSIYFMTSNSNTIDYNKIVEAHITVPAFTADILNTASARGDREEHLIKEINQLWEKVLLTETQKDYATVAKIFQKIEELDPNKQIIALFKFNYYKGLTHLKLNQPQQAITAFSTINIHDDQYGKNAYWYLALAKLMIPENRVEAIEMLETIADKANGFSNSNAASEILKSF